ncbi:MAG: porin [Pseudomonadota bacterium]|nr:porin [Pseudomonadota bacterium]
MKKFLTTAFIVAFGAFVLSAAKAEVSLSGYQEFYMGSADQTTQNSLATSTGASTNTNFNGFSNGRFTRLIAVGTTTLDSGIEVTGTYTLSKDNDSGGDNDTGGVAVDQNDIVFSGAFGNIAFGNNFSAGSMMHYRGTTLVPTAEIDNDQVHRFITAGNHARGYGRYDEAGYALDGMKIRYMSNVYEGFSFGISYEPCMVQNSSAASATDCNSTTAPSEHGTYTDLTDVVLKYATEFEGVGLGLTYGLTTGNTNIIANVQYNDLRNQTISAQLTYGGLTLIARNNDLGDSGQIETNTDDGDEEADTYAVRYDMGNFSLGYTRTETEKGITSQSLPNTAKYSVLGAGYNLGGGVNLEAAYLTIEQKDGATTETDADMIITKLSFGF